MAKTDLVVYQDRWSFGFTGWCFSCKATVRLPLLPGGATILCHFWNKVVFKQSRGDNAYALCLDISSCIGSKITHNCNKIAICIQSNYNEKSRYFSFFNFECTKFLYVFKPNWTLQIIY